MEKEFLLYITINNVNGKVYGGQHIGYKTDDYIGSGPTIFLKAVRKYGKNNFTRRWLKLKINSKQKLDKLERVLIRRLKYKFGRNCYNVHIGGTGGYLLYYCDEKYRKEVSSRISLGKKEQYKNGQTELQILGRKKQSLTLKEKHKKDEKYRLQHLEKCKQNSLKMKEHYKKYGLTENQKSAIKKLKEFGHFKIKFKVIFPNGNIMEYIHHYNSFVENIKMEGYFFTQLSRNISYVIKRRTKMTRHNFEVGCVFELIEKIEN